MHLNMKMKRKQTMFGVLKTVAYLFGYPLLVLVVAFASIPFMKESAFGDTWKLGILIALIPWAVSAVVQIALGLFTHNQHLKTVVVGAVGIVCILGCALAMDLQSAALLKDANAAYNATTTTDENGDVVSTPATITVPTYRYHDGAVETTTWTIGSEVSVATANYLKGYYKSAAGEYASNVNTFNRIYNVELDGSVKKEDGGYVTNSDLSKSKVDGATGIPFNPNGLVSECYVYSTDFALNVLINYNESVNKFASLGEDIGKYVAKNDGETDEEYRSRLGKMSDAEKLEAVYQHELALVKTSAAYIEYQGSDEYQAAYGEDGTAYNAMLTVDRVKELATYIVKYVMFALEYNEPTNTLVSVAGGLLKLNDLKTILSKPDFTFEQVLNWLQSVVSALPVPIDVEQLRTVLTEDNLQALIDEYAYYYSPSVRPAFDFFDEAVVGGRKVGEITVVDGLGADSTTRTFSAVDMRNFAFARYYAKTNGAVIGSVLVSNNDDGLGKLLNADGNIGQITMTTSGYPASFGYSLAAVYQLKADMSYSATLYPLLAVRRYLYMMAGLVLLSIVLYYQFARREEEAIAAICAQQIGGAQ